MPVVCQAGGPGPNHSMAGPNYSMAGPNHSMAGPNYSIVGPGCLSFRGAKC